MIVENLPHDASSAYFRAHNPDDYMWSDPTTQLLAHTLNTLSELRAISAVQAFGENTPPHLMTTYEYGPDADPADPVESEQVNPEAAALEVANDIRAEIAAAAA